MTQRVDLSTVMDRIAIDSLITGYAVAVDDAAWADYEALFTAGGRADYRTAGGIEGTAAEVAGWLAGTMRLFPVRQHLIVNRRLRLPTRDGEAGDTAELQADYVNPMRLGGADGPDGTGGAGAPPEANFFSGGRYAFGLSRTEDGWRLREVVVHEKWRHVAPGVSARS
ncbi:nuclear transport factor 2 family protein [Streptomyces sp. GC420]|uniref:nuclear transport factor 2 family protein n=1 Tax=Streptomyces sp. GC420 TaxID=2697568 RepID=UPI0014151C91|nr:nuclear transport factor 2 family protein [Streptomyces sp. GC420]NBM19027.1 nuclear transport factor 2 family protein [Streptomyces sp. GC420]